MKTLSELSRIDLEMRYMDLVIRLQDAKGMLEYLHEDILKKDVILEEYRNKYESCDEEKENSEATNG